jgi:hypothetical protein
VAPKTERLTILCENEEATDVLLKGSGKLKFLKRCRGYGNEVMFQTQIRVTSNATNKDVIPDLNIIYDCCENEGVKLNIEQVKLFAPLKHVTNNLEDLEYASHKVDDVEKLISEQEWKLHHSARVMYLSFLTILGLVVIGLIILCYCCKCCHRCFPNYFKSCKDCEPIKAIVFKPKFVNKVNLSDERLPQIEEEIELTSSVVRPSPGRERRSVSEPVKGKR